MYGSEKVNCGSEPDARSSFGKAFHNPPWGAPKPKAPSPFFFGRGGGYGWV